MCYRTIIIFFFNLLFIGGIIQQFAPIYKSENPIQV